MHNSILAPRSSKLAPSQTMAKAAKPIEKKTVSKVATAMAKTMKAMKNVRKKTVSKVTTGMAKTMKAMKAAWPAMKKKTVTKTDDDDDDDDDDDGLRLAVADSREWRSCLDQIQKDTDEMWAAVRAACRRRNSEPQCWCCIGNNKNCCEYLE